MAALGDLARSYFFQVRRLSQEMTEDTLPSLGLRATGSYMTTISRPLENKLFDYVSLQGSLLLLSLPNINIYIMFLSRKQIYMSWAYVEMRVFHLKYFACFSFNLA